MSNDRDDTYPSLTLAEYRAMDEAGQITRPLTDKPMRLRRNSFDVAQTATPSLIDQFIANAGRDK